MKTLPKYFVILRDATNPLWDKYIKWLFETYHEKWGGDSESYYGYDGSSNYKGTNMSGYVKYFSNNPTIITLDYWNECVNGFQLPKKWCVELTKYNHEIVMKYCDLKFSWDSGIKYATYRNTWDRTVPRDCTEITFEQFKQYVLKQDNMEKKLIGYKLIKPEYSDAALKIANHSKWSIEPFGNFAAGSILEGRFKNAGVLDLWFEPVYEEETKFKVGDWVLLSNNADGWGSSRNNVCNKVLQITKILLEGYSDEGNKYYFGSLSTVGKEIVRKATPEEVLESKVKEFTAKTGIEVGSTIVAPGDIQGKICWDNRKEWRTSSASGSREVLKFSIHPDGTTLLLHTNNTSVDVCFDAYKMKLVDSTPSITIKGYKAEFTEDSVSFGCQTYSKEFVMTLANCLRKNDFAMEIRDEIMEIAEYFESL